MIQVDYVIVGCGVAGAQAAQILHRQHYSFVILEAGSRIGGRINTERVIDMPETQNTWLKDQAAIVDHGAAWLSFQHTYCLKWIQQLQLRLTMQYETGYMINGINNGKHEKIGEIAQLYASHTLLLREMLNQLQGLSQRVLTLKHSNNWSQLFSLIQKYDKITVQQYLRGWISDEQLLDLVIRTIEIEQCVPCATLSIYYIIETNYSLDNLRTHVGLEEEISDSLRVKEGMIQVVRGMLRGINSIRLNQPVIEVDNTNQPVVVTTTKNVYCCKKVIWTVPNATSDLVNIMKISKQKQTLFTNQAQAYALKVFLIFKTPFWRPKYSGLAIFSKAFPFSEMCEVSSGNCGILVIIVLGDRFQQWALVENKQIYLRKTVADMFLDGDVENINLRSMLVAQRTFAHDKYLKSCYQSIQKMGAHLKMQQHGNAQSRDSDQNSIIFIGSERGAQFRTYVEGAIRCARQKMYRELKKGDPWNLVMSQNTSDSN